MNPSSSGWIDKFGHLVSELSLPYTSFLEVYESLLKTGLVYGMNVSIPPFFSPEHALTEDEKAKINLLTAFYYTYTVEARDTNFTSFLDCIFNFYGKLDIANSSFFSKIFSEKKTSAQLEKLINSRIYLEDNVISKTFNSNTTNSFLFIDVLAFKKFIQGQGNIRKYAQYIEHVTINFAYHALNSKETNEKDKKLAQLFASSLTFSDDIKGDLEQKEIKDILTDFSLDEITYFLDVICLSVWEDQTLNLKESEFIFDVGNSLGFSKKNIEIRLKNIFDFFELNAQYIPHLKDHNLASQFYDGMSKIVNKIILRNSKRLQKEIMESKELVLLLSKSTTKELSLEEKKKVQNQLLDIFKSIPSLAIFILPGGAILLPIFVRLIPKLLPSSFDENRIEK